MDLKQITQKLNTHFIGETRKLVFWYDDNADFVGEVDDIALENAKLYKLEKNNQFYTKYFLERLDTKTNYLLYAPFPKPNVRDNHLADTLKYSKEFFADRASLVCVDLQISEELKPVIQKYIKFFGAKDRAEKFYEMETESYSKDFIETALMSILCKARTASFDEVVRAVITENEFSQNKCLAEFEKYGLTECFWRLCEEQFGYRESSSSLKRLTLSIFATCTKNEIKGELPADWNGLVLHKAGNSIGLMQNIMNSTLYSSIYDVISTEIAADLKAKKVFAAMDLAAIMECDMFTEVDDLIISWIVDKLLSENTDAMLAKLTIPQLCRKRQNKHFGVKYFNKYKLLYHAFRLISSGKYTLESDINMMIQHYVKTDCYIDNSYREFYSSFDSVQDSEGFEQLRELIENIYTNDYLDKITTRWNATLAKGIENVQIPLQRHFYKKFVSPVKDRIIVIISDAMRYEVAHELFSKFKYDEKCDATIEPMLGVLPSFTKLGMAALLPNRQLEMSDDYSVTVDGKPCDSTPQKEDILKAASETGKCFLLDDIKTMKREDVRKLFAGLNLIYIYHNQIDARGDKLNSENEVFIACSEAVEEIFALVKRLTESISAVNYLITADHGFIYKRDKIKEYDKIDGLGQKGNFTNKRFIISAEGIIADGTQSYPMASVLGNEDTKQIVVPLGSSIFKAPGGGQNYVHGGSSPQEMLIPVINVKTQKGHMETKSAPVSLVSIMNKITGLIQSLDFIQSEPVSDVVKQTTYKLYFVNEDNEKISNECTYVADNKEKDASKRIFRLRFTFKNSQYDRTKKYSLAVYDLSSETNIPVWSQDVVLDIAFANDFGF